MVPHSALFKVSIQSGHRLGLLAGLLEGAARSHLALRRTSFLHASVAIGSFREFESELTDWRKDLSRLRLANWGRAADLGRVPSAHYCCCFHPL